MRREDQVVGGVFGYRFPGEAPDHALLVCHGTGGHGGIYDVFSERYSETGAEVWCIDLPGCGRSASTGRRGAFTVEQWVHATSFYASHIKERLHLPVVVLGSSLGVKPASAALMSCDDIEGAVLMGSGVAGVGTADSPFNTPAGKAIVSLIGDYATLRIDRLVNFDVDYGYPGAAAEKHRDPLNTWEFDLSSWASLQTYQPERPLSENTKPVMFAVGENDPLSPPFKVRAAAEHVGGPVEVFMQPNGVHQLMLFHTEDFVAGIRDFVGRTVLK